MEPLPRTDSVMENKEQPIEIDYKWMTNFVDTFNSAIGIIENELASLDARLTALGG